MSNADLIREARDLAAADREGGEYVYPSLVDKLADALERAEAENERLLGEVADARRLLEVGFALPPGMLKDVPGE